MPLTLKSNLQIIISAKNQLSGPLRQADSEVKGLGDSMKKLGRVAAGATAAIATAAVALGTKAVKTFAEFETSMRNVWTLIPIGKNAFDDLSESVLQMSKSLPQSPEELGASLYDIMSAGITNTADAMMVLEASSKAAVAGLTDAKNASKGAIAIMNAFGKSAADIPEIFDKMFATVRIGVVTFPEISESVGRMASQFAGAGATIDEMLGSLAFLTRIGLNAQQSVTRLAAASQSLIRQKEAFRDFGAPVFDAAGKFRGMEVIVGDLREQLKDLTSEQQLAALQKLIPERRAAQAIQAMVNRYDDFRASLDGTADSAEATNEAFRKQIESLNNQIKILTNNMEVLMVRVGGAVAKFLTPAITELTKQIKENSDEWAKDISEGFKVIIEIIRFMGRHGAEQIRKVKEASQAFGKTAASWELVFQGAQRYNRVQKLNEEGVRRITKEIEDLIAKGDLTETVRKWETWRRALPLEAFRVLKEKIDAARKETADLEIELTDIIDLGPKAAATAAGIATGMPKPGITTAPATIIDPKAARENLKKLEGILLTERQQIISKAIEQERIAVEAFQAGVFGRGVAAEQKLADARAKIRANEQKKLLGLTKSTASEWTKLWDDAANRFAAGIGDAVAGLIVANENFAESMSKMMDAIKRQLISTLIEIAIKKLIIAALGGNVAAIALLVGGAIAALRAQAPEPEPAPDMRFQEGGVVPRTGLALLHEGETVLPARETAPIERRVTVEIRGGPVILNDRRSMDLFARQISESLSRVDTRSS